jgi:hypothetical protein
MAYGDLQTFLPRAEGEVLDVERARAEGASRANYLSEMDQFYKSLEQSAKQFDITQALAERQFTWMSGFEEKRLDQEKLLAEEKLEIDRLLGESQSRYYDAQVSLGERELELAGKEQGFLQGYYKQQFALEERRFGLEEELADYKMGGSSGFQRGHKYSPTESYYSRGNSPRLDWAYGTNRKPMRTGNWS